MRYGSVCSGIEAATVAWHPLGWEPAWFSEIEAFPSRVLAHHYPEVPNLGDMTTIAERIRTGEVEAPPLLVGGTPCQAFSLAGLRRSLEDERGNLTLSFVRLADAIDATRSARGDDPCWILWENVPGVFTVDDNAFGHLLAGLVGSETPLVPPRDIGWTGAGVVAGPRRVAAWRILDAQFFGVAQRRRRVYVLARGGARAWAAADALLPVTPGVCWHPAPRGKAGTRAAPAPAGGARFDRDEGDVARALRASDGRSGGNTGGDDALLVAEPLAFDFRKGGDETTRLHATPEAPTLTKGGPHAVIIPELAPALQATMGKSRASGNDGAMLVPEVSPAVTAKWAKGTGGPAGDECQNLIAEPVPFDTTQITHPENRSRPEAGDPSPTLAKTGHAPAIAIQSVQSTRLNGQHGIGMSEEGLSYTLTKTDRHAVAYSIVPEGGQGADLRASEVDTAPAITTEEAKSIDRGVRVVEPVAPTLTSFNLDSRSPQSEEQQRIVSAVFSASWAVRRLTEVECERLQAFPDGYTAIPKATASARYAALGNSMATVVMQYLARAIEREERRA